MIKNFIDQVRLTWRLMRDTRVPAYLKAVPLLPLAYVFMPFDIIPDFIPILGQLDDIALIVGGMRVFEMLVPEDLVAEHRRAMAADKSKTAEPLIIVEDEKQSVNGKH
jgi:uncharacterized membrane protein YkvA (DUF1232 family)